MRAIRAILFAIVARVKPPQGPDPAEPTNLRHIDAQRWSHRDGDPSGPFQQQAHADRAIAELAHEQHGVVSLRQLLSRGISRDRVRGRIRRGQLHLVHRGVYAVGHQLLSREGRWIAAVLAGGGDSVLSDVSAAEAWGLIPRRHMQIEVTLTSGWRAPAGLVVHVRRLPDDERTVVDGIQVTSVPRTILDLAGSLDRTQLERAINEMEVRRLTDQLSVPDLMARHPGRRGSTALRAIFVDRTRAQGVTASELEAAFAKLVAVHRLPAPRYNADLAIRGRFLRPDALWEREKLIVELDGRAAHGTRHAFESDRARDRLLLLEGWRVARVTWLQLRDSPEAIVAELRASCSPKRRLLPLMHEHRAVRAFPA